MPSVIQENFKVTDDTDNILISVTIGNAQIGTISIALGTTTLSQNSNEINACVLGTGTQLKGGQEKLLIVSSISDFQQSNLANVTYKLKNGGLEEKYETDSQFDGKNTVHHIVYIVFT
jgi:hypothetical protein